MYLIDEENGRDPNLVQVEGRAWPAELLYATRLSDWLQRLAPDASEALRLAARSQHICRWMIPRESYEATKGGYLKWRNDLKTFHARKTGEILTTVGYPPEFIRKVQELNLKKNFPNDPESRVLEDALCLVFLEFQFGELAARTSDEKMINALQKSWRKMTEQGRAFALQLPFGAKEKALLEAALAM
jgi:hypothetical protein